MRTSTPLLLLTATLTTATTLTPLLAVRYIPQQIQVNFAALTSPCSAYSSKDIACGALCLHESYTCCPDKLGGCPSDASCVKGDNGVYGCCPKGGKCTGDGVVVSSATTGVSTSSKSTATGTESKTTTGTSTATDAETTGDTKTTSAETTADAQPTTTGGAPAGTEPTPTGGAGAAYAAGPVGAIGAAVVALLVL
ncbi:hypothetical protein V500_05559 [Pseudogymnoascus sp. VKM F-4518 (FW-2643)]|nr:hypothetical protein V500_05559 [Pseudogymnoascus sp. VKM F-4518 (FW-2643)]